MLSERFLDIRQLQHRFPKEVATLQIPLTLLHNHPHAPANTYLVYLKDFKQSIYMSEEEIQDKYFPCSWYLEDNKPRVYEFSDEKLDFDLAKIEADLKIIEGKGYTMYGTTVRPIRQENQFETQRGHLYVPSSLMNPDEKYSQTAINGMSQQSYCTTCYRDEFGGHWKGSHFRQQQ